MYYSYSYMYMYRGLCNALICTCKVEYSNCIYMYIVCIQCVYSVYNGYYRYNNVDSIIVSFKCLHNVDVVCYTPQVGKFLRC